MKIAHLACAFGRHRVNLDTVRRIHGASVSRCKHCTTPMEESAPHHWTVQYVRDAGLGGRMLG